MSGLFHFPGGSATIVGFKLTTTSPTVIAGSADEVTRVAWFHAAEIVGGVAALTVELYDATATMSYYLRFAKAMTAKEEYHIELGYPLPKNWFLRATASVASNIDVTAAVLHPALEGGRG